MTKHRKVCSKCAHYTPATAYAHHTLEPASCQVNKGSCALSWDSNDGTPDDTVMYGWDCEGYAAGVYVGPNFGCIHWSKKP